LPAPQLLAAAALIVAGAYTVFGLTGFGSTVIALPLLALFGAVGLLSQQGLVETAAVLLPTLALGFWLGARLHARVPAAAMVRSVYALLVVAGLTLLARALAAPPL